MKQPNLSSSVNSDAHHKPALVFIAVLLISQPIFDILTYWLITWQIPNFIAYIRSALILALLVLLVIRSRFDRKIIIVSGFYLAYIGLQYFLVGRFVPGSGIREIEKAFKVFLMPLTTLWLIWYARDMRVAFRDTAWRSVSVVAVICMLTAFISWITGTNNYTYNRDWIQIGLNGWFYSSNAQSIILITVIPMFLTVVLSLKNQLLFLAAVAASWLVLYFNGTRAAYVGLLLGLGALLFAFVCHRFVARSRQLMQVSVVTLLILVVAIGLSVFMYPRSVTAHMAGIKIDQLDRLDELDQPVPTPDPQATPTPTKPGTDPGKDDPDPTDPNINAWRLTLIPKHNINPVIAEAFTHFVMNATTEQLFDKRVFQRRFVAITMQYSNWPEQLFGYGSSWYAKNVNDLESDYAAIFGYYGYFGVFMYFAPVFWLVVRLLASLRKKRFRDLLTVPVILPAVNVVMLFGVAVLAGRALLQPSVSIYLSLNLALLYLAVAEAPLSPENNLGI